MPKFFSEITLVPIGTALLVFGSGAIWMTRISVEQDAHASLFEKQTARMERIENRTETQEQMQRNLFQEIRERLIRIEVSIEKRK